MSNNLDTDRSITTSKMFPIDLAPQKITIVKNVSNAEVKMAHLLPAQPKTTGSSQIMTHAGSGTGLMRPGLSQIISPSVASQPQMIVGGSPILQGAQIVSQGSQLIGQNTQIISQSQLLTPSGQILSPATQIISQGTQLSAQVSTSNNTSSSNAQTSVVSSVSGTQVLNVGGAGGLMVNSSVRTLPPTVRVLPPLSHHNTRPAVLSSVNMNNTNMLVSKGVSVGATSHVPRGLAAGASLAVRPVAPASITQPAGNQGGWSAGSRGRTALVYGARGASVRAPLTPNSTLAVTTSSTPTLQTTLTPVSTATPHSTILTLPTTSALTCTVRGSTPRPTTPTPPTVTAAPRPLPLLQRNYQPAKVVGVASVGVRGVGNSAPAQLYYEVRPQPAAHTHAQTHAQTHAHTRALAPYAHAQHQHNTQVSIVNAVPALPENRPLAASVTNSPTVPRPSILRKRDVDGSPLKNTAIAYTREGTGWEDVPASTGVGSGGSTTISAASSPVHDDETEQPRIEPDVSPRKKPRKQILSNEVRQCDYPTEETPPTPPPVTIKPPPKRPQLSSSYVCGWRSTALHFVRPSDVRRREPRARDIVSIASQKHVLSSAMGWKMHHLTAQMDDLMELETDADDQLTSVMKKVTTTAGRPKMMLQPVSHNLVELLKGNIQRSKIVCESIQEARDDVLRVFTHKNIVSDILTRQADKRCFRKHRSQS